MDFADDTPAPAPTNKSSGRKRARMVSARAPRTYGKRVKRAKALSEPSSDSEALTTSQDHGEAKRVIAGQASSGSKRMQLTLHTPRHNSQTFGSNITNLTERYEDIQREMSDDPIESDECPKAFRTCAASSRRTFARSEAFVCQPMTLSMLFSMLSRSLCSKSQFRARHQDSTARSMRLESTFDTRDCNGEDSKIGELEMVSPVEQDVRAVSGKKIEKSIASRPRKKPAKLWAYANRKPSILDLRRRGSIFRCSPMSEEDEHAKVEDDPLEDCISSSINGSTDISCHEDQDMESLSDTGQLSETPAPLSPRRGQKVFRDRLQSCLRSAITGRSAGLQRTVSFAAADFSFEETSSKHDESISPQILSGPATDSIPKRSHVIRSKSGWISIQEMARSEAQHPNEQAPSSHRQEPRTEARRLGVGRSRTQISSNSIGQRNSPSISHCQPVLVRRQTEMAPPLARPCHEGIRNAFSEVRDAW